VLQQDEKRQCQLRDSRPWPVKPVTLSIQLFQRNACDRMKFAENQATTTAALNVLSCAETPWPKIKHIHA
jgi:hypothetical protein